MRGLGHAGMVVVNPKNDRKIDTRSFGSNRASQRAYNNKLVVYGEENIVKLKRLSLFPSACLEKRKYDEDEDEELNMWEDMLSGIGNMKKNGVASAVTPTHRSSYPTLKCTSMAEYVDLVSPPLKKSPPSQKKKVKDVDDDVVDDMLARVTNRAFDQTGVLQLVVNVDLGKTEEIASPGKIHVYNKLCAKKEIVCDVIVSTFKRRKVATSIECLDTVKPFINSNEL